MIGIVDYGMGNLFSVSKALERIGVPYIISESPEELNETKGLILPGVGSFKDAMALLKEKKLDEFLYAYVDSGRPLLGICLGMQLLFQESEENGRTQGLGLLRGRVVRIPADSGDKVKVPHMGWNQLAFHQQSPVLHRVEEGFVYFVHSYYVEGIDREALLASTVYSVEIPAVVGKNNVFGMQFHPEKSSRVGMQLLTNFAKAMEQSGAIL
ncbi:imidazole glycerol phosphate synthase subunit HisH [Bacillus badius]|uniref:Imidazole glycerol phosphate synthase subunit HisH n=1 Tax=Bacillus badius TaxID=1455 RepID=A0ABR5AWY4_BACBA|nr:imidazole glycerol phosphate synthase subunit HisH [Bacillus badius]KIL79244.1 Imidazole glycerol phosphate synthase amidotransferase subunit [Bacillus badius]KZR59956.1 imidazole glycerol phosphate synthase, glutamine amidotransferase subunit [Bacillus badius]MED4714833.1 imidazole glycerol phosphate synthase subunit HisH [Bacillus badius]